MRRASGSGGFTTAGAILRRIPAYELLGEEALHALKEQADWILSGATTRSGMRRAGSKVGLAMGYEKFVMDLDSRGAMLKMIAGMEVGADSLTRASYLETGPGENFLSTRHTIRHFATANYLPGIAEAGPYETWAEGGRRTVEERANDRWKKMLADFEAPPIDSAIDEALRDFMARRKAALPDEWY